jgi:hypothetical protein
MQSDEAHHSAAVAAPIGADEAAQALKHGARGAFVVAGIWRDCSSSGSPFISDNFRHLRNLN